VAVTGPTVQEQSAGELNQTGTKLGSTFFLSPLDARTREFSQNSLQTPIPHKENVKPIGRHEITYYYAGRETHGVVCGGVPHGSGQDGCGDALLRVRVAARGCCFFLFCYLRCELCWFVGKGVGRTMPRLGTGGKKGLTLCSFSGRKILPPSLGALPCEVWRLKNIWGEVEEMASTAFYILLDFAWTSSCIL
jgi:hypothetical protein